MKLLEELFTSVLDQIPEEPDAGLTLNASNCTEPPEQLATANLKLVPWNLGHIYGDSARYDVVHFFADKPTYRRLALLLFASVFHPNHRVTLHLSHPETVVTSIRIGCLTANPADPLLSGLAALPVAYGYHASPVQHLHPLWREEWRVEASHGLCRATYLLPFLHLTNESEACVSEEDFARRSVLAGFGGPEATVTFAALLLDIANPQTELREFCLESPSGNWSVAIGSAEARLWIGYDYFLGGEFVPED